MAQWIWKFGEFETYHNMLLHNRRQQYGYTETPVWKIYPCDPVVCFHKKAFSNGGKIHIYAKDNFVTEILSLNEGKEENGIPNLPQKFEGKSEIVLPTGNIEIMVRVSNLTAFPTIFVTGEIESDESWEASDLAENPVSVGTSPYFTHEQDDPTVFPFKYEPIIEKARKTTTDDNGNIGALIDFGKETFAKTVFHISAPHQVNTVTVRFGESEEEALSHEWCVIHFDDIPDDGRLTYPAYAFRYIFVSDPDVRIDASYEHVDIPLKGSFVSDEKIICNVWNTAAYTFQLCSREFFIDGIKRDRWVWSADVYQSLFVAHSLFMDSEIEKRTLIALGGKEPVKSYINGIMDYDYFWVLSLYEYYQTYGEEKFLLQIAPQLDRVLNFCATRECEDGFVRGRKEDWIFIDWAPMDKTGALLGEQVLYAAALDAAAEIYQKIEYDQNKIDALRIKADILRGKIFEKFYDESRGVFIDSFESGKKVVTRQNNLLAYLYMPLTREQKRGIYENVVLNDKIMKITTPYFKFYENQVHCEEGNLSLLTDSIRNYYGKMLSLGATTLYEQFDPNETGVERFGMYGHPFEKSLCHAWSCSPIYLLAHYIVGVKSTDIGYRTFDVRPNPGDIKKFNAVVPLPDGNKVTVIANEREISVMASRDGGTLKYGKKEKRLPAGITITVLRLM